MLQVIFFSLLFGIALAKLGSDKTTVVLTFVKQVNDIILKMIDLIMLYAPFGVFALIADVLLTFSSDASVSDVFMSLLVYSLTVIAGLLIMILVVYPLLLKIFTSKKPYVFLKQLLPVQLLAFSTSSSAATLPLTMEICQKKIKISKEISSFVLPIGATVNMDGTSLYQSVAALFIAQLYGIDLTLADQLTIVVTALLASVGAAAVPGAGMIMLIIVLNSVGLPNEGIAVILAVDRILDMLRTSVNVTSDATVATIIDATSK
jgi:Na+/H+-dicarboxylate symporter